MERHHHHNHWCANAWVGAPWACGDHHHHHSKENFEPDASDMYSNSELDFFSPSMERYTDSGADCDKQRNICVPNPKGCSSGLPSKSVCKKRFVIEKRSDQNKSDPDAQAAAKSGGCGYDHVLKAKLCDWDNGNKICKSNGQKCRINPLKASGFKLNQCSKECDSKLTVVDSCATYSKKVNKCLKHFETKDLTYRDKTVQISFPCKNYENNKNCRPSNDAKVAGATECCNGPPAPDDY